LTLPRFFGITGIEIAQPIAYFLTSLVSLPMALSFLKRLPKDE
jgi:hypothetical protein